MTMELGEIKVVKDGEQFGAKVQVKNGYVYFQVTELHFSRQSIDAVIEIELEVKNGVFPSFIQRIDLRSSSAIDGLVTRLNNAYGNKKDENGYNWALILNSVVSELSKKIKQDQVSVTLENEEFSEPEFMLSPFLQQDAPNLVFASSEAGKTWFVQRLALSLVTGVPFLGFPSPSGKNVLYLDYEDSRSAFASRMYKLCRGMGVEYKTTMSLIAYYKPAGSLRNNIEIIKSMVKDRKIDLVIIDAGGDAAGGSPNDEEKVIDMFNALEEIPCTKLMLHHEPKYVQSQEAAFYGSMYWKARSRVAWRIEVESEEEHSKLLKLTIQKKSNLPPQPTIYYRQIFMGVPTEAEWNFEVPFIPCVELVREIPTQGANRLSPDEEILGELISEPLSESQIAQLVGKDRSYVGKRLRNLKETGKIKQIKQGRSILWKLS